MQVKLREALRRWRRIAGQHAVERHLEVRAERFHRRRLVVKAFMLLALEAGMGSVSGLGWGGG